MATSFESKCIILGELWVNYKGDANFKDFIDYNDLGLPLAYAVSEGLAEVNGIGQNYIEETWLLLVEAMEVDDEEEYSSLDELFDSLDEEDEVE